MADYTDDYTASVANRYKPKTKVYDSGLAARFQNAGKDGYTMFGGLDWDYRGGMGPDLKVAGTEGWTPEQWQDFGAKGGIINDAGQMQLPGQQNPWFGQGGYLQTGAQAVNALSGLANAYTGMKMLGLAEDEFDFNKSLASTSVANQADLINQERANAAEVGVTLAGSTMTDADKEAARQKVAAGNVKRTI